MICIICNKDKEIDDFPSIGSGRKRKQCKSCYNEIQAERRKANPERARESWRKASAKYASEGKRGNRRLKEYGLTQDEYDSILETQENACAICKRTDLRLVIDHCHETGVVRGILCFKCNTGLGALGDNLEGLQRAIEYLR